MLNWLQAGQFRDRISVDATFFVPIQTRPKAHQASCTMGTGSFPGVKWPEDGANHPLLPSRRLQMG
jgi:hypothetical protein